MAAPRRPSHELENLAGLLADFGAGRWTPDRVSEASAEITARSLRLESFFEVSAGVVQAAANDATGFSLAEVFDAVARDAHFDLFASILTTAGRYRQPTDLGGGHVAFGGPKGQTTEPLFRGTPARDLPTTVARAYDRLADLRNGAWDSAEAVRQRAREQATDAAVLFYCDWSGVHPFYDGNGRVGRYVVSVYLLLHGRNVRWGDLDAQESKWSKRINGSLKQRTNQDARTRREYERRLTDFWRSFVDDLPEGSGFGA